MSEELHENFQEMDFETAFNALKENVALLENEELPLEKTLSLFERGQHLAARCALLLEKAELRVQQLSMQAPLPTELEE